MKICIIDTQDLIKAEIAKSKLESLNIPCELRTNDAGGSLPHLGFSEGIKLYVFEEDQMRAIQEIAEPPAK